MGCFALSKPLILHAVISFWSLNIFSFVVFKHVLALVLDHKDLMKNTYEKGDLERLTCQIEMSTNVCSPLLWLALFRQCAECCFTAFSPFDLSILVLCTVDTILCLYSLFTKY